MDANRWIRYFGTAPIRASHAQDTAPSNLRFPQFRRVAALLVALGLAGLAACESSSSEDSPTPTSPALIVVLTDSSGGNLTAGTQAGVWTGYVTNGNCQTGSIWTAFSVYFPAVSGAANLKVTAAPGYEANAVMFSIWIDKDANSHLSNGDMVWGANGPTGQIGKVCDSNFATLASHFPPNATMDWSASGIPGISGSSTWGGGMMPQ